MSNQQAVVDEILDKTNKGSIAWSITSNQYASEFIFQPSSVYRIFKANYQRTPGDIYEVLLVEKKFGDPDWDFELEKYRVELLFIQGGVLVASLDEYSVDQSSLITLVRLAEIKSAQAKRLFGGL
jgi:hypothetical protein